MRALVPGSISFSGFLFVTLPFGSRSAASPCACPGELEPLPLSNLRRAVPPPAVAAPRLAPGHGCSLADDRVKQVKAANDIVDVVGGYLSLRQVGHTFKGLCPFHDDHRPSFDVDPSRQRYRCWSCGKYGDVLSLCRNTISVTFPEAIELLARRAGICWNGPGAAQEWPRTAPVCSTCRAGLRRPIISICSITPWPRRPGLSR